MVMRKRKFAGWGMNGKPFTKLQFANSYIKTAHKPFSYAQYIAEVRTALKSRSVKTKRGMRAAMR